MAFNIANYQEKYRWTGYSMYNETVQLRIYERTSTALTVKTIRNLVDIKLQMQGSSDPVYAPIVKTSLRFTLVDAPDMAGAGEKSGDWQEFYTPDSTKYLVELYRRGSVRWRGYITPDSWKESLDCRSAVTITARDNLGHLQDFQFNGAGNEDGLIKIRQLVDDALDIIDFPMALVDNGNTTDAQLLRDSHGFIVNGYVAVSELEDGSWWDALEKTLEAIGYTLRFRDAAKAFLAPVRNVPLGQYNYRSNAVNNATEVEFYGGDRELDPAVRSISEKVDFGGEMELSLPIRQNLHIQSGSYQTYDYRYATPGGEHAWRGQAHTYRNLRNDYGSLSGWQNSYGFMDPQVCIVSDRLKAQDGGNLPQSYVLLSSDQDEDHYNFNPGPTYRIPAATTDITIRLEFARGVIVVDDTTPPVVPYTMEPLGAYIKRLKVSVQYVDPSTGYVWYYTGDAWQRSSAEMEMDVADEMADSFAVDIPLTDISGSATLGGYILVEFRKITHLGAGAYSTVALAARLTAIKATINSKRILKTNTVTTLNNSAYNVKIERDPAFGAMSVRMPYVYPKNYTKALWVYTSGGKPIPLDYAVYLNGYASSTALPLPVQIHKQLLTFCHLPMEILQGNCGAANKAKSLGFGGLMQYKGKYYVIQGGTLDVLTNRISGVVLHEFAWYDDMWDESANPNYEGSQEYVTDSTKNGANGNSAIKGSSSSSGGGQ